MTPDPGHVRVLVVGLDDARETAGVPSTLGLARLLAADGHDVRVVTGLPHDPQGGVVPAYRGLRRRVRERDGEVRLTRVPHPVAARPTGVARLVTTVVFALRAARAARRGPRPDVVIAVSPALLAVGAALSRRWGTRGRTAVGVVVHELHGTSARAGVLAGPVGALERALLTRADGVAAAHEALRPALVDLGVGIDRIATVRDWSDVGRREGRAPVARRSLYAAWVRSLADGRRGATPRAEWAPVIPLPRTPGTAADALEELT